MFKWSEYDTYLTKGLFLRDKFQKIENIQNYVDDVKIITDFQNEIIAFGTLIEKHLLLLEDDNHDVITSLEHLCEHIYEWFTGDIEKKLIVRNYIYDDFELFFSNMNNHTESIDLAVCSIIRDEAKYIEEWIEYHIFYGVKKFYLYDNESVDNIYEVLYPYISEGIVELITWPGSIVQLSAYNDAIERYKHETKYMAFIDADEFLTPIIGENLPDLIDSLIRKNVHSAALGVNWRVFGTSGYITEPEGLVIKNYIMRAEDRSEENKPIKTIGNPRRMDGFFVNAHEAKMKPGFFCTSEMGTPIVGPYLYESDCRYIKINHYAAKSKNTLIKKRKRGWPDQEHHDSSDESIEYIIKLKENVTNVVRDDSNISMVDRIEESIRIRHNKKHLD